MTTSLGVQPWSAPAELPPSTLQSGRFDGMGANAGAAKAATPLPHPKARTLGRIMAGP